MGGFEHFHTWTYRKIVPNQRLEFVQHLADGDGNLDRPRGEIGMALRAAAETWVIETPTGA